MIYLITNTIDGKTYVGKTQQQLEKRWYQHCKNAEYGVDTYLYRAMRKYGTPMFTIEKICDGYDEEEIALIEQRRPEYNMTLGGDGGDVSNSPNYIKSMIERRSYAGENNPNFGKHGKDSPNFGKKRTPEQKANISNSLYLKSKKKSVIIDGIQYDSVLAAARAHNRSERWVRLHDERNKWDY